MNVSVQISPATGKLYNHKKVGYVSKKFRKMICKSENIELLGNWEIYNYVREQLWDDAPQDKAQFTRVWNQRWKNESVASNDPIAG